MEPGMKIRRAVPDDAPRLLEMGLAQFKESGWSKRDASVFNALDFLKYIEQLDRTGLIFVADSGRVVGMVGADITTLNCNRNILLFQGIFWYCEPEFRREAGLPLLAKLERAAKSRGVRFGVVGVDDGERSAALSRLYQRVGYKPAEQLHIKRL